MNFSVDVLPSVRMTLGDASASTITCQTLRLAVRPPQKWSPWSKLRLESLLEIHRNEIAQGTNQCQASPVRLQVAMEGLHIIRYSIKDLPYRLASGMLRPSKVRQDYAREQYCSRPWITLRKSAIWTLFIQVRRPCSLHLHRHQLVSRSSSDDQHNLQIRISHLAQ